ncbi:ArsR family transcriptional regulator [Candidatus Woesearchaeota archaeon]|jgi:predicted transcriptional regulator|nr:MAG: ArsR family transcriptional regulator [Candidatus Woesearchaeota archaeon]
MVKLKQKITIVHIQKPRLQSLNDDLQWLGMSLGLFNLRDKDKSCFRIFIELLKSMRTYQALSSDELAERIGLSRGTVVHHLRKLEDAGLVVRDRNKYHLRDSNLKEVIEQLEKDLLRTLGELKRVAKTVDDELGLTENRETRTVL